MNEIVKASRLKKEYLLGSERLQILKGIDIAICRGESLAIMGPSGSGKSTLMHLLGCLDRPSSGRYELDGRDLSYLSDDEISSLRASKIGFVFQSFNLINSFSVEENVALPFIYHPNPPANQRNLVDRAIAAVGLSHRKRHLPRELSGGEMQRAAIARALVIDPLLIFADEPTGNLDSKNGGLILELFDELHQAGKTIVLVTHDEAVGKRCQRMIRMKDGQIDEIL
ncbi:MAG: macrolide transporter ATP-binding protein [Chlamydiales bacterium]|nr:macrolide transporter ATP-binding protein [Chlamydiales bacterium]